MSEKPWVTDAAEYVKETVYRLTEEDIIMVCEDNFPHFTEEQIEMAIGVVESKLDIDWMEEVAILIEAYEDTILEE